jgi:hypothetical protein
MVRVVFLITSMLLSGCAGQPTYDFYYGPQLTEKDVATIVPKRGCLHCVAWIRPDKQTDIYIYPAREGSFDTPEVPEKFSIPPGRYELNIRAHRGRTVGASWVGYVDLEPGHTYEVKSDSCTIYCWGSYEVLRQTWVWIEDSDTSEVLLGLNIPQDDIEAVKWFRYAATRDGYLAISWQTSNARYQSKMGNIYELGRGVQQNYVLAYMWYSIADSNDESRSSGYVDEVAGKMNPEQIAEAKSLAKEHAFYDTCIRTVGIKRWC